jgi:hypothetical protein
MTDPYKLRAERLGNFLATRHGIKLKHANLLEAIAAEEGCRNWNTLRAQGQSPSSPTADSAPAGEESAPSVLLETLEEAKTWVSERMHAPNLETLRLAKFRNEEDWRIVEQGNSRSHWSTAPNATLNPELARQLAQYLCTRAGVEWDGARGGYGYFVSTLERQGISSELPFCLCQESGAGQLILSPRRPFSPQRVEELRLSAADAWNQAVRTGPLLTVVVGCNKSGRTSVLKATAISLDRMGKEVSFLTGNPAELAGVATSNCSVLSVSGNAPVKSLQAAAAMEPDHLILDFSTLSHQAERMAGYLREFIARGVRVSMSFQGYDVEATMRRLHLLGLSPQNLGMPVAVMCVQGLRSPNRGELPVFASHFEIVTPQSQTELVHTGESTRPDAASLLERGHISEATFVRAFGAERLPGAMTQAGR